MEGKRVLVVGGTGYLGQHLLQGFSQMKEGRPLNNLNLAFTHHSNSTPPLALLHAIPSSQAFRLDLHTGEGFDAISQNFGQPHVVVNCAALSVPRACEKDPAAAMSVNVPSALVNWLLSFKEENNTLLIHLSTDQVCWECIFDVMLPNLLSERTSFWMLLPPPPTRGPPVYEGVKSFYKEEDLTVPVNVYGKSKVAAEQLISEKCSNFAILRSSIIFGPPTISPIPKSLPIQWIDSVLSKGEQVEFFYDEFRCPVYVGDLVKIVLSLANRWLLEDKKLQLLLNVGGPDRVSRLQMAEAVAAVRGYDISLIKPVSASSVDRGVLSPADISMDISKMVQTLDILATSFKDGVKMTLGIA